MNQFAWLLVAVGLSIVLSLVSTTLLCTYLLRRFRLTNSIRLLRELQVEVSDLSTSYNSLLDSHKKLAGRLGGRPPKTESGSDWKAAMRSKMSANILAGKHPASNLGSE